ncbi:1-aminocyclopropane-1-carboxylate synthase [Beauveria bassiana ARSEF 2860]|uniref:1-aminocyclopropane-1-carboxylate synthase n=1 Tax=Beauveria bassiana (strain ARSEF 2860) TaxID=655819 RepID=J4W7X9_BEAB2|nr:1-aminocyclopropane-1-carboxylate synthase [Beauveria bassiana ARSEF 2860]EJP66345.1 1-aminocyclopropane-1-carboxylate synthase [Beauveria bassiana ARSEF 2860]
MAARTSARAQVTAEFLSASWKFATRQTYDKDTNPDGVISFALAENKLVVPEKSVCKRHSLTEAQVTFEVDDFNYGNSERFPKALAVHLTEYLQPCLPIEPAHVRATSSCSALHDMLAWAVADPGDAILLNRPIYGRFELDFGNREQIRVLYADTDAETCLQVSAIEKYEEALADAAASGIKVRAILIVNPNNPLGQCYHRDTLVELMKLCQRHQIHLISDEVYACSVFPSDDPAAVPFTSLLSIDPRGLLDADLLHVEYGFAKDFASGGMKLGALVSRSQPVLHALDSLMRFHKPAGPILRMACLMLEDRVWCRAYIDAMRGRIKEAHAHVTAELRNAGILYLGGSNAGLFLWIDLSAHLPAELDGEDNAEFALAKKALAAGVFVHPTEEHANKPGWFRLVYTQDPDMVTEGIRRLKSVMTSA